MKDAFNDQLQQGIQEVPLHDALCVIGDFNAHVGATMKAATRSRGRTGVVTSTTMARDCDLCEDNSLVIGETLFPHREIHKMTWTSPDGKSHTQIDHVINSKWKNSLLDELLYHQAAQNQDWRRQTETKAAFQLELRNRFQALREETVEPDLSSFHQTVRKAGRENLGIQKKDERRMDTARNMG